MLTDTQIIEAVENDNAEFGLQKLSVISIETGKADKYGAVKHYVFAVATWADGSKTENRFDVTEEADGTIS